MKATKNTNKVLKLNERLSNLYKEIERYERNIRTLYNPNKYEKMQIKRDELSKQIFELYENMNNEEREYLNNVCPDSYPLED